MFDDDESLDAFLLAEEGEHEPSAIAGRLVESCDEFRHLLVGEALVAFFMRTEPKEKAGRLYLGEMCKPQFSGALGAVGAWLLAEKCGGLMPDFVMLLDRNWWVQAPPEKREALVYHELYHAIHAVDREGELRFTPEGDPVWALRAHDLEEFNAVVRRYGAWSSDIVGFLAAARDGGAV